VGQISGDTEGVDNIVEGEVVDERRGLEEEGQRLSDTTGCSCDDCTEKMSLTILDLER
jgi:hypothetical protein